MVPILAFRLLIHDKGRLMTALAGIAIAVLLMFVQLGFRNSIFDSALQLVDTWDADIVIQNKRKSVSLVMDPFPHDRVYQARSVAGVESARALWMTKLSMKNLATGKEHPIRYVAFEPDEPVWGPAALIALAPTLKRHDTILVDAKSRKDYGSLALGPAQLARRDVEITGQFELGTDFTTDGTVISSVDTFLDVSHMPKNQIEFVLIKVKPGISPASVLEPLRRAMPGDVLILTREEMRDRDIAYWSKASPIGIVMGLGMFLGFLAGIGIVYQILFAQIADYLKEFATLRAIGWNGISIVSIVLFQAVVLSVLAYIPSVAIGAIIYWLVEHSSGLPMRVTVDRSAVVLVLTAVMCVFAALFAVRRLLEADPAELFS